jgi:hypothetical protein
MGDMHLKLFSRGTSQHPPDLSVAAGEQPWDRLQPVEPGTASGDAVPSHGLDADTEVRVELARLAGLMRASDASRQRAELLMLVADKKGQAMKEERPLIRTLLHKRTIALAGAAVLLAGAAGAVGAAGGVSEVAGNVRDVLTALDITARTPDQADVHLDAIAQSDAAAQSLDTAGEHADEHADHGLANAAERGDNAGDGIQNASEQGLSHANDQALDGPGGGGPDGADADPPDQANDNAGEGAGNAGDGAANGNVDLPDEANVTLPGQANDNADDGADNAGDGADNGGVELPPQPSDHADDGAANASIPDAVPDQVDLPIP